MKVKIFFKYQNQVLMKLLEYGIFIKNFQEAEKYIISILNLLNYPTEKELPPYVINIIIFFFLSIGKNEQAVQVIKYRKIPKIQNN